MKRYKCEEHFDRSALYYCIIVGTDREIRSLYKTLEKKGFYPVFLDFPKFREGGMYGIVLDNGEYYVINSDSIVSFLVDGIIKSEPIY